MIVSYIPLYLYLFKQTIKLMFPQQTYWYNSVTPDKLTLSGRIFDFAVRIHNMKYSYDNSITYLETRETGKVYNYENIYNIMFDNISIKITLCESFHSCSTKPLNHPSIRGTSIITLKYNIDESSLNDETKSKLFKFNNTLDTYIHKNVKTLQQNYDTQYFWENPSYYESDGNEPVSETIACRQIL